MWTNSQRFPFVDSEGPATTAGCLFVAVITAIAFSLLFALLWYTANLISSGQ